MQAAFEAEQKAKDLLGVERAPGKEGQRLFAEIKGLTGKLGLPSGSPRRRSRDASRRRANAPTR
ncbi:MAG: hypothetical protein U1F87_02070 [Kiritimatiellia bacterium]